MRNTPASYSLLGSLHFKGTQPQTYKIIQYVHNVATFSIFVLYLRLTRNPTSLLKLLVYHESEPLHSTIRNFLVMSQDIRRDGY